MEQLNADREAESARLAAELAALRDSVAGVLQRFFSNECSPEEAAEALRELGCEVRCVAPKRAWGKSKSSAAAGPSDGPALSFQPRLLLDDPARMTRLMQAAAAHGAASTPRLLEGPSAATASGGSITPRMHRDAAPTPRAMQAALTFTSTSSKGGSSGAPTFTLSWRGADGSSNGTDGKNQQQQQSAPSSLRDAADVVGADTTKTRRITDDTGSDAPAKSSVPPLKTTAKVCWTVMDHRLDGVPGGGMMCNLNPLTTTTTTTPSVITPTRAATSRLRRMPARRAWGCPWLVWAACLVAPTAPGARLVVGASLQ